MSVYAQVRVITKEPKGREVNDGDSFSFNKAFSEKLYRIKINSIQLKETVEENKKTNDQVLQDRQYQVCPHPLQSPKNKAFCTNKCADFAPEDDCNNNHKKVQQGLRNHVCKGSAQLSSNLWYPHVSIGCVSLCREEFLIHSLTSHLLKQCSVIAD